jgi:hypothetical protein
MRKLLLVTLLALVAAPTADAGCWATVKLSSMPTARAWTVDITPLQHGRTRLPDARPRIEIRNGSGGWRSFAARTTATSGVFRARVVFPDAGTWRFRVWDGFAAPCGRYHSYRPVTLR